MLVCHTAQKGVNHFMTMCILNLNFKILGEFLVSTLGGPIIF